MRPGSHNGSIILETKVELEWAAEVGYKLREQYPQLEKRFKVLTPEETPDEQELSLIETKLMISGLRAILAGEQLIPNLKVEANQFLADLQKYAA